MQKQERASSSYKIQNWIQQNKKVKHVALLGFLVHIIKLIGTDVEKRYNLGNGKGSTNSSLKSRSTTHLATSTLKIFIQKMNLIGASFYAIEPKIINSCKLPK